MHRVGNKEKRIYLYDGRQYPAEITFKRMRNIVLRFDKSGEGLLLSAPYYSTYLSIDSMVKKYLPKLLSRKKKAINPSEGEGWIYLLGQKEEMRFESEEAKKKFLKEKAMPLFEERVRHYEEVMGVKPPYKVKGRFMTSRYGANSRKTHSLSFSIELIHYPVEVIDSVVIHELAHHFAFDHSSAFYKIVLTYCPEYWALHSRLRKRQYE